MKATSPVLTDPLKWDREAAALGERHRVFCGSMMDWAERHKLDEVNRWMDRRREHLFGNLVPKTPNLDWLLLSKRANEIAKMVPTSWASGYPSNVWIGCTVEDQRRALERLPHLVRVPAAIRFLSVEPLLGPLDLRPWLPHIDWVIVGGESGHGARPSQIDWVRHVRDQVTAAGKAFFFKQWGHHEQKGGDGDQLIQVRRKDFRLLDGREWNEFPTPRQIGGVS